MSDAKTTKNGFIWLIVPGVLTAIVLLMLFYTQGYAPFGEKTLAAMDANIQYLDFYSYFKDVLSGSNSIAYSFGKTLGGTNIAVFSYYLSSPFCLLIPLFDKADFQSYFDWVILMKLSLSAITFAVFLRGRFRRDSEDRLKTIIGVILSVSYALCQYSIAQSSNIMWFDGVYLLPLMLLSVYRIVQGKSGWTLSLVVGLSLVFNWYTAGMNCLFSIVWLVVELLLFWFGKQLDASVRPFAFFAGKILHFAIAMTLGVLLGAVLFFPTISALQNSTRGGVQLDLFKDISISGDLFAIIKKYVYGAKSAEGSVALFAGSISMIGCISLFFSRKIARATKFILGGLAVFGVLMFYWQPLVSAFSLLKRVGSYWYRYSYLGEFILLFIAAHYFMAVDREFTSGTALKSGAAFGALLILLGFLAQKNSQAATYLTAFMFICIGVLVSLILWMMKHSKGSHLIRSLLPIALICCCIGELQLNAYFLLKTYHAEGVSAYQSYVVNADKQVSAIQAQDAGVYRMTQTSTRNMGGNGTTANYNEALAYGYWSISGYTSSPDDQQRVFLENLGYRRNGENMCVINTSILSADSLLGVKYVLSGYPIKGLEKVDSIESYNGKDTYRNPYALPMAFIYEAGNFELDDSNPFVYQISIYRQLTGREIALYTPLQYEVKQTGDVATGKSLIFEIQVPSGNFALYGNLPWRSELDATLNVNDAYQMAYSRWLSPSVFYIPADRQTATIEVESNISYDLAMDQVQFYALNLDLLKELTGELSSRVPDRVEIQNGFVSIAVDYAASGQNLFLSIPYDKGWTVRLNGSVVQPELVGNCLYSIRLVNGSNQIEMIYRVPYLNLGIVVSALGIAGVVLMRVAERKRKRKPIECILRIN